MSACRVLPLGLGTARRPIVRKGSVVGSETRAAVIGSSRAAGRPRLERTNRSPRPTRRRMPWAFFRNSSRVTVFIVVKV